MRLEGKVAIISGSGGSIGGVTARGFAREGARVLVTDINVKGGKETVRAIKDNGGEAVFVKADIAKVAGTEKIVKTAIDAFDRVDILFNNAGVELIKPLHEYTEEDYDKVVDVHLKGSFFCIRYVLPYMMKQGGGSIINMGSIAGLVGWTRSSAYNAAKGAIVNLTRHVALDYASCNIRCNCVCPGAVATEMLKRQMKIEPIMMKKLIELQPLGRAGEPEEIASLGVFLASDESKFITGVSIPIDGGFMAGKMP